VRDVCDRWDAASPEQQQAIIEHIARRIEENRPAEPLPKSKGAKGKRRKE
jgi:hypothetical protein